MVRTCIGCGQREVRSALVRLQVDAAGELVAIHTATRGRSAYLHARQGCVSGVLRSKGLGRSLRATVDREARQRAVVRLTRVVQGEASDPGGGAGAGDADTKDQTSGATASPLESVQIRSLSARA